MSPDSFAFTLTVPRDARLAGVVRNLCAHATTYARLSDAVGGAFCEQVLEVTERAVEAGGGPCELTFESRGQELRVTVAGETIRQPLTA